MRIVRAGMAALVAGAMVLVAAPAAAQEGPLGSAGDLRAQLTALDVQHVNLTTLAVQNAVQFGADSPQFTGATRAVDANTNALADAIGSVYGSSARQQFDDIWSEHVGFFVDYTKGAIAGDDAVKQRADAQLRGTYRDKFSALLSGATQGRLGADAVKQVLAGHIDSLEAAIDAIVAKRPDAATRIQEAAGYMTKPAAAVSAAIDDQFPDRFTGSAEGPAADLLATLTSLDQQHVAQTVAVVKSAVAFGPDSPQFRAAAQAVDANTNALADGIGSVYGSSARQQFDDIWSEHVGFFVAYTNGALGGNDEMKREADAQLRGTYRDKFSALLSGATDGRLAADAVKQVLAGHIDSLEAAIDGVAAKSGDAPAKVSEAELYMQKPASAVAGAVVAQFPARFGTAGSGVLATTASTDQVAAVAAGLLVVVGLLTVGLGRRAAAASARG